MERISEGVRKVYPGNRTDYRNFEKLYAKARRHMIPHMNYADMPSPTTIESNITVFCQVGLRRTLELTDATIREVNAHSLTSAVILARALIETACIMFYAWEKVETSIGSKNKSILVTLGGDLTKLQFGIKDKKWGGPVQPEQILKTIDRASKYFKGLRGQYDDLSEIAHPNYGGMMGMFYLVDKNGRVFIDPWKRHLGLLTPIFLVVDLSFNIVNVVLSRLRAKRSDLAKVDMVLKGSVKLKRVK